LAGKEAAENIFFFAPLCDFSAHFAVKIHRQAHKAVASKRKKMSFEHLGSPTNGSTYPEFRSLLPEGE